METRQLKYFVTVAEELHFGQAAKRLHISQPPLSQQIMKFEAELGVQLFHRSKRSVTLTPEGRAFLEDARVILQAIDKAKEKITAISQGTSGSFNLGYIGPALDTPLTRIIREFKLTYPKVKFGLTEMSTNLQLEALQKGEIDAGVVRLFKHDTAGFECVQFHKESYALILPSGHKFEDKESVNISELAKEDFIFFPRSSQPRLYDEWMKVFARCDYIPQIVQEATTKAAAMALVAAHIGISIVPENLARRALPNVVFKKLTGDYPSLEVHIVYRENTANAVRENFVSIVKELVGSDEQSCPPREKGSHMQA